MDDKTSASEREEKEAYWNELCHLRKVALEKLEHDNDGVALHALKLLHMLILLFTPALTSSTTTNTDISVALLSPTHPFLTPTAMAHLGDTLLEAYLAYLRATTRPAAFLTAAVNLLFTLLRRRPSRIAVVMPALLHIAGRPPKHLTPFQTANLRKTLGIGLSALKRIPEARPYRALISETMATAAAAAAAAATSTGTASPTTQARKRRGGPDTSPTDGTPTPKRTRRTHPATDAIAPPALPQALMAVPMPLVCQAVLQVLADTPLATLQQRINYAKGDAVLDTGAQGVGVQRDPRRRRPSQRGPDVTTARRDVLQYLSTTYPTETKHETKIEAGTETGANVFVLRPPPARTPAPRLRVVLDQAFDRLLAGAGVVGRYEARGLWRALLCRLTHLDASTPTSPSPLSPATTSPTSPSLDPPMVLGERLWQWCCEDFSARRDVVVLYLHEVYERTLQTAQPLDPPDNDALSPSTSLYGYWVGVVLSALGRPIRPPTDARHVDPARSQGEDPDTDVDATLKTDDTAAQGQWLLDAKDRTFTELLLELPYLPSTPLRRLLDTYCRGEGGGEGGTANPPPRQRLGLATLRDLILYRPVVADLCMDLLTMYAVGPGTSVRSLALPIRGTLRV